MTIPDLLRAVRYPGSVTASSAVAWFTASRPVEAEGRSGGGAIGYLLAPDRAEWFRCPGEGVRGPDGPRDLAGAFEVYATGGGGQLRWVHQDDGEGWAVSLSEDAATLPEGTPVSAGPERRRLAGTADRLLAGRVVEVRAGWATLATARYAPYAVPVRADVGQEVWAELAEYAVSDEHGNLSVIDTLLLSLTARPAAPTGPERRA